MLTWSVMHPVDENSPLYGMDLEEMKNKHVAFFISFTGIDQVLSQTVHANHRYEYENVVKAIKFKDIIKVNDDTYEVDFTDFHEVELSNV